MIEEKSLKGKGWYCDDYCISVDPDILVGLKNLFRDILELTYVDAFRYLRGIDVCSAESKI